MRTVTTNGPSRGRLYSLKWVPAAAAVLAICLAGCAGANVRIGRSLSRGNTSWGGLAPLKPGFQLGIVAAYLHNRSHSPLTIDSIGIPGQGIGTVIRIVQVKIAPYETGDKAVPGGAYETDPPISDWGGTCRRQVLLAVHGYRLAAGAYARVWIVIQAKHPGQFFVHNHLIRYSQNGVRYQQSLPEGYRGTVTFHAPYLGIDPMEARCLGNVPTTILKGWYR